MWTIYKKQRKNTKFKEIGDARYIYQNELEKAFFQHDMTCENFKGLTRRTASDKILCDKEFNIPKNSKYDGYQKGLASMVYKIFDKKTAAGAARNEIMQNKE